MSDLKGYVLEEGRTYEESVRAGPIDEQGRKCYSTHFTSNMRDGNPLRTFLNKRALEVARDLASRLGEDIIVTIGVQKDVKDA